MHHYTAGSHGLYRPGWEVGSKRGGKYSNDAVSIYEIVEGSAGQIVKLKFSNQAEFEQLISFTEFTSRGL